MSRDDVGFQVLNRIAVEELEAWFFGDVQAIHLAYQRVSPALATKAAYRDPDAINGGTWEAMERELQRAGYFKSGLAKIKAARAISAYICCHLAIVPEASRYFSKDY